MLLAISKRNKKSYSMLIKYIYTMIIYQFIMKFIYQINNNFIVNKIIHNSHAIHVDMHSPNNGWRDILHELDLSQQQIEKTYIALPMK